MAGNRYTDEQRTEAVELYLATGITQANRVTGIPRRTLQAWMVEAGHDPAELTPANRRNSGLANLEKARQVTRDRAAERRDELLPKLVALAHRGADAQMRILEAHAAIAEKVAGGGNVSDRDLENLKALKGVELRDVVGVTTRAIHDLQLILGDATSRQGSDGQVHVHLTAPRPDRSKPQEVLDLGATAGTTIVMPAAGD